MSPRRFTTTSIGTVLGLDFVRSWDANALRLPTLVDMAADIASLTGAIDKDRAVPRRACPGAPASSSMPLLPSLSGSGGAGGRVCTGEAYPTANGLRNGDEHEDICHVQ